MKHKVSVHTDIEYGKFMADWEEVCSRSEERNKVGRLLENIPENLSRELLRVRGHL